MNQQEEDRSALIIRPASFNDIPYIQQIAYDTWPVAYGEILPGEQLRYMLNLFYSSEALSQQLHEHHLFFLAVFQYQPVGFASFNHINNDIFKLQKLYVLPGVQKTGAGKALLQHVETTVKSMGGTRLLLNVNRQNTSINFYYKYGFQIIKVDDVDIGSGYFMNDFVMEKVLAEE